LESFRNNENAKIKKPSDVSEGFKIGLYGHKKLIYGLQFTV